MRNIPVKTFLAILAFFVAFGLKAQNSRSPQENHQRLSELNKRLKEQEHNWFRRRNYKKQFDKEREKLHAKAMREAHKEEHRHLEALHSKGVNAHSMKYEKKMFEYQGQAEGNLNKYEQELAKDQPNPKKVLSHGRAIDRSTEKMERSHNLWLKEEKKRPPE